ncbi:MAG TPA: phage tail sheath subtilisin-like domain-containing protein [Polyangia bacterium]|jgi:hypothetical protein|nr:phage tail sheath subtilisin-like domain-containing protein [Polyangia bacterium]
MAFNIGINVVETEGKAAPAIAGAPTSVAGLVLRSRRGPTDRAVRVSNFQQFAARFGAHATQYTGAYGVEGFFGNGGLEAYIARAVGAGVGAASVTLKDRAGSDSVTVAAGYRGTSDVGAWGNDLYLAVQDNPEFSTRLKVTLAGNQPARLQGDAIANALDLSSGTHTLTVKIDGGSNITVTLDKSTLPVPAQATRQDIADAINAKLGQAAFAADHNGGLLIVSRTKGSTSKVDAVGGIDDLTRTALGFGTTNSATGAASANNNYSQAQVESIAGLTVGAFVRLDDGITQDHRQVTGLVQQDDGAGGYNYFVQFAIPPLPERNEYRIEDKAAVSTCEFNLTVSLQSGTDPSPQLVESWEKITMDKGAARYAPLVLNDAFTGSTYVRLTDLKGSFTGRSTPAAGKLLRVGLATPSTSTLTRVAGDDGATPSANDYKSALGRFDSIAIQLLAFLEDMPDGLLRAVTRAGLDYCVGVNKGDCMFVGHTPPGRDVDGAKAFGQEFRAAKVYGALYWPWITVTDPAGSGGNPTHVVPPTGHVLGVYARIDQTRGVWKAPAGNEALIRGALAVERDVTDADHTDLVKNGSVNGIRNIRGTGIVIDASRTLSTDNRWLYVNVRLLFNFVKASLREGLRWVKQEPNREALWNMIKFNTVTPFLLRLYQNGAFGPGAAADVFTVVCGPENNPPSEIQVGNLKVEIYFYPSRPAETIIILVGQQEGRPAAGEK